MNLSSRSCLLEFFDHISTRGSDIFVLGHFYHHGKLLLGKFQLILCCQLWPQCADGLFSISVNFLYRYKHITYSMVSFLLHTVLMLQHVPIYCWTIFNCLGIPYFVDEYLGSFSFWDIMDSPAERSVHVALCGNVYISPEYIAKRKPHTIHTIFF